MLQNSPQADGKRTNGQGKGGGPKTIAGRERQVAARVSNGVHFQNPVLPGGIESEADWEVHLASLEEALQPVGAWEKLCVYRIALAQWQFFRLTRHVAAITAKAIMEPANEFRSSFDDGYVHGSDVAEVLGRPALELEEEFRERRDLLLRISALAGQGECDIAFTEAERRQILVAIARQPTYNAEGEPVKSKIPAELLAELEGEDAQSCECEDDNFDEEDATGWNLNGEDTNDRAADNEDPVVVSGSQLREEINQIAKFKRVEATETISLLADTIAGALKKRSNRLEAARTHIGMNLVASDEKTVARVALYERQLDSVSRRYMNDLVRSQLARSGQAVPPPIAVDVNLTGNAHNVD